MALPALLLVAALAIVADGWRRRRPSRALDGPARYWRWAGSLGLRYGVSSVTALALLGGLGTMHGLPVAFLAAAGPLGFDPATALLPGWAVAASLAAGTALNAGGTWARARRGKAAWELVPLPSITPRWTAELPAAAFLSLVAGVAEELFFRLLLPLLVVLVGGPAWLGFAVGVAAFASLHRYQGPRGVVLTALVGAAMAALYLASGQLWLAMAVHAAIDLNALVVRPLAGGRLRRGWTR